MFHHPKNIKIKLDNDSEIILKENPPIFFKPFWIPRDMWSLEIKLAKGISEIGNEDIKKFILKVMQNEKHSEYIEIIFGLRSLREKYSNKMSEDTVKRLDEIDKLLVDHAPSKNRMTKKG